MAAVLPWLERGRIDVSRMTIRPASVAYSSGRRLRGVFSILARRGLLGSSTIRVDCISIDLEHAPGSDVPR